MALIPIKDMITDLAEAGYNYSAIAKVTGSTPATICRASQGKHEPNITLYRNVLEMWAMLAVQREIKHNKAVINE